MYYGLDFHLPLSCACVRARVYEGERVWVFFVCLFCMPCVEWVWMFLVLLFYVIYSRTIASIANVFCWLYPTLNKVYLILSYFIFFIWTNDGLLTDELCNFKTLSHRARYIVERYDSRLIQTWAPELCFISSVQHTSSPRSQQHGRHFADEICNCAFLN